MLISEFPISNRTKNVLLQNGFLSEVDFNGKFLEDIKSLEGMGSKGVMEIREYLHGKFGLILKLKPKPKKISNPKEARILILHFIGKRDKIFWPKEMLAANKLLALFDLNTLLSVVPNEKASTLLFYLCEEGRKYIRTYLPSVEIKQEQKQEKSEDIFVQDVQLDLELSVKKPKSLKDFLFK
jgi:hypothetical protein